MKPTDATTERLWRIAEPVCVDAGYELVDLSLVQSRGGWVLRIFIDHLEEHLTGQGDDVRRETGASVVDGSRIGFTDCERLSRELGPVLDVEDPIAHAYELEVSSPGLDRPLRTIRHFQRFLGQEARIVLDEGLAGRRNFKGTLRAVHRAADAANEAEDPDRVSILLDVDGVEFELPYRDIASARLVPDWDTLFGASKGRPASKQGRSSR